MSSIFGKVLKSLLNIRNRSSITPAAAEVVPMHGYEEYTESVLRNEYAIISQGDFRAFASYPKVLTEHQIESNGKISITPTAAVGYPEFWQTFVINDDNINSIDLKLYALGKYETILDAMAYEETIVETGTGLTAGGGATFTRDVGNFDVPDIGRVLLFTGMTGADETYNGAYVIQGPIVGPTPTVTLAPVISVAPVFPAYGIGTLTWQTRKTTSIYAKYEVWNRGWLWDHADGITGDADGPFEVTHTGGVGVAGPVTIKAKAGSGANLNYNGEMFAFRREAFAPVKDVKDTSIVLMAYNSGANPSFGNEQQLRLKLIDTTPDEASGTFHIHERSFTGAFPATSICPSSVYDAGSAIDTTDVEHIEFNLSLVPGGSGITLSNIIAQPTPGSVKVELWELDVAPLSDTIDFAARGTLRIPDGYTSGDVTAAVPGVSLATLKPHVCSYMLEVGMNHITAGLIHGVSDRTSPSPQGVLTPRTIANTGRYAIRIRADPDNWAQQTGGGPTTGGGLWVMTYENNLAGGENPPYDELEGRGYLIANTTGAAYKDGVAPPLANNQKNAWFRVYCNDNVIISDLYFYNIDGSPGTIQTVEATVIGPTDTISSSRRLQGPSSLYYVPNDPAAMVIASSLNPKRSIQLGNELQLKPMVIPKGGYLQVMPGSMAGEITCPAGVILLMGCAMWHKVKIINK